ncbi:hypothetical protein [Haloterrigena alkaliphila]|uniref:Uncharacterized protein n=1 Tax=Haloterrigena alkaliphila TaxID=2816475 RepID=A0A8A2VL14_9EURY|nr:hypothetical protein [Haloterrigena alkaliphila]QSX01013.1 hypothetical protein J0X25_08675 [Haloterrigena alkaliphila]
MRAITPRAEAYFEELFQDYLRILEEDHDVTTAKEYLEFVGATSRLKDPQSIFEYLEAQEIGIDAFLECPPLLDQDIAYASLNPGMKGTIRREEFISGQYGRIREAEGDIEEIAWRWSREFHRYLTHSSNPGPQAIVESLRDSLDVLPSEEEVLYEDYVSVDSRTDLPDSYYGDVYHTQFFRLPSPDGSILENVDRDYWRARFADELKMVNPSLFIAGCKDAWLAVIDHIVGDPAEEIIPHRDSKVTRKYGNRTDDTAVYGVFEVPKQDLWVVTSYQESRYSFLKPSLLRENLEYVNSQIHI